MSMKSNKSLKEHLENQIPKLYQIEKHALSKADAYTKELYMSLLAAIAFEDRKLAQSEERYLQTLCNSVKDVDLESIKRCIDKIGDTLEKSLKAIEDNNLGVWLFIDALILCRLDSVVTEKESKLLGSLADSLKLSRKEVSMCLKLVTIILSQDEDMLFELIPEVPEGFPFYALHEAYNSPWFEAKFSFAEDLAEGRVLKGKYFIHKPVRISGERELNNLDLIFSEGTNITIEKEAKLKITGSKLSHAEIICAEKSSLILSNCNFSGGKGIYSGIESSLSVRQCKFDNVRIVSDKASKIVLDEVSFENLIDKRAMSLTNCLHITIKKSKFISCGYNPQNIEKEEGGALLIRDCAILIDTCTFENCTASGDGGAISFWKSSYGIKDSKFIQCKSGLNGGAIIIHDVVKIDSNESYSFISKALGKTDNSIADQFPLCKDSEFIGCHANDSGGAIFAYMPDLRFEACLFEKCKATNRGGGLLILGEERSNAHFHRVFKCRLTENESKVGNGLWMEKFNCNRYINFSYKDYQSHDVMQSTFHKCATNHDHSKNSLGSNYSCDLEKVNTFTK